MDPLTIYISYSKNQLILGIYPMIYSTNGKLVVWVGGLDSWDPLLKGIVT